MTAPATYCNECGASNPSQASHCFACHHALQPPASSPPLANQAVPAYAAVPISNFIGSLVPSYLLHSRYSIVSQIGSGGFGAVYQARDTLFSNRLVAIKEMSQDGLSPRELAEATTAFEREALLLADLSHPNLPRIHDHFTENGRSYVVMDFIAGDTLEDYLDKVVQRLPVEATLEIGLQLCTVLDYLHAHQPPIIFRDLKPSNMMRTADNHLYLIDFGIARHFKPGKAKDTIPLGSKGYAAPEQYGKAQTTPQSDIYGLGATLHQLLTGDDPSLTPFHFEPVRLGKSPISTQLNALLEHMVEMEMSKRPASVAVVRQELQHLLALQTAHYISPSQTYSRALVKRRNFLLGLVSVVATCSISSAITTFVVEKPDVIGLLFAHPLIGNTPISPSTPAPSPAGATILSKPLYTYRGHDGSVTAIAWSPDGQHIASAGTLESSVQVWDASTGNIMLVPVLEIDPVEEKLPLRKRGPALFATNNQRVDALAWSSDSTRIASAFGNDTVEVWNVETGENTLIRSGYPGKTNALAWSPDGNEIAAVSADISVELRSAATGSLFFTYTGHAQAVLTLAWSLDGKLIASGGVDGTVRVWDAVGGDSVAATGYTYVTYRGHAAEVHAVAWSPDGKLIASGGADGTVQVWDAATGRTLFIYRGHAGGVNAVAWSHQRSSLPSGQSSRIASGGVDATVQVWSFGRASSTMLQQEMALAGDVLIYRGHAGPVTSVTWNPVWGTGYLSPGEGILPGGQVMPDAQRIASGSEDGTVQVWQAM